MALITFTKVGLVYEAEFEVEKDFTLHIERPRYGMLRMYQRGTDGKYALVEDLKDQKHKLVMDYECQVLVPKKWIKVVTEVLPTYAEVVSSGEVTEIKSQSKEVEMTANGTTDVTPDAGYSYLSGVSVKVNVPQEGGGNASTMEYLDVSGVESMVTFALLQLALARKCIGPNNNTIVGPAALISAIVGDTVVEDIAVGIDLNAKTNGFDGVTLVTTKEAILSMGITEEALTSIPRLTEEEFYNLNA